MENHDILCPPLPPRYMSVVLCTTIPPLHPKLCPGFSKNPHVLYAKPGLLNSLKGTMHSQYRWHVYHSTGSLLLLQSPGVLPTPRSYRPNLSALNSWFKNKLRATSCELRVTRKSHKCGV